MVVNLLLRRSDEIGRDDRHAIGPLLLSQAGDADRLARRLRTGPGEDRQPPIDLGNRLRNDLGVEVAILKLLGGATLTNLANDLQEQLKSRSVQE